MEESKEIEAEESVQISAAPPIEESGEVPELGDVVKIIGGRFNGVTGRIYYRDEQLIRILPENFSDRLIDIPIDEEGQIEAELEIDEILIVYKRTTYSFVELYDLRVDAPVEAFKDGKLVGKYKISAVDADRDAATFIDEVGSSNEIVFDFYGIPLDAPFTVLRVLDPVAIATAAAAAEEPEDEENFEGFEEAAAEPLETIVIEAPEEVKEIPLFQRIYPELVQKTDFLQDILTHIDPKDKRNPKNILKIRNHVELLMRLKSELISYRADGNSAQQKPASVATLGDLMRQESVPLMRPILNVRRKLYYDEDTTELINGTVEQQNTDLPNHSEISMTRFDTEMNEQADFINQFFGQPLVAGTGVGEGLPNFYAYMGAYAEKYQRPWLGTGDYVFQTDGEFFRRIVPYQDDDDREPLSGYDHLPGYNPDKKFPEILERDQVVTDLKASLLRGLANAGSYINAERAELKNYLLFPYERSGPFAVKRSGSLLYDIETAKQPYKSIQRIFEEREVGEEPTPTSIMLVGSKGTTLGNISLEEYFKALEVAGFGMTDFLPLLKSLGLTHKELSVAQQEVFTEAIANTIGAVKVSLAKKREELGQDATATTVEQVTVGFKDALDELFLAEPLMKQEYEKFKSILPVYENSDIAIVAYLMTKQPDLFESAMGGQTLYTAKRRLRAVRLQYLNQLRDAQARVVYEKARGQPPQPNKCHHVTALATIRRVRDDDQRMALLVRFVAKYEGARKDQWIDCRVCKKHLICGHELLQIMQYAKPREKAILQKEMLLHFGGGQFHGRYQCRNCGQALAEMDFDTNLEFDDDGRPMMGRAVIDDKDEEIADAIETVLSGGPNPNVPDVEYTEENKKIIYSVAQQIAQVLGVQIDSQGFKSIVERSNSNISRLETRQEYIKKNPKAAVDYDTYINTALITITACAVLLEIQVHIPDYIIRYTIPGCVPSFTGWPIGDVEDKSSIEYVTCGLASMTRNEMPWRAALFTRQRSFEKKKAIIMTFMNKYMTAMIGEPTPQQLLEQKKDYFKRLYGRTLAARPADIIPAGFYPRQTILSAEEQAAEPINAAAGADKAAQVWILEAHKRAKETALLVAGSPFSETGCCFVDIKKPTSFWEGMTEIPGRTQEIGVRQTHIAPQFKDRIEEPQRADLENFLELFIKVCFRGERVGHPHELNMLHKCDWCDFQFPKDPSLMTQEEAQSAFASQEVDVSLEAYQALLDATRKVNSVGRIVVPEIPDVKQLFVDLGRLDPAPCDGWAVRLREIYDAIQKFAPGSASIEIAAAFGPLSEIIGEAERYLETKMGKGNFGTLEQIMKGNPHAIKQSVLSYVIIPLKRILTGYNWKHLSIQRHYELNHFHVQDLVGMIEKHVNYLSKYEESLANDFVKKKVEACIDQLQGLMNLEPALREAVVPGGKIGLQYFVKAMVLCPLAELVDPHKIPRGFDAEQPPVSALSASVEAPMQILANSLLLYRKESLAYSPDDIKLALEARAEKELVGILSEMDKMTPDEKKLVLLQKKLGIGRWAVGGTNAIWKYNADRYEVERDERARAGIMDFGAGIGPGDAPVVHEAGEGLGAWGMGGGREAGYDHGQVGEDDY